MKFILQINVKMLTVLLILADCVSCSVQLCTKQFLIFLVPGPEVIKKTCSNHLSMKVKLLINDTETIKNQWNFHLEVNKAIHLSCS